MQGSQRLHAIEREGHLDVHRLLDPQRAIVIEGCDALAGATKSGPAFGDPTDEFDDGLLRRSVIP